MERPQEQAPEDQVGNACDKNDRDDLDEEEDEPADDTFKEKIEKDLQLLIEEICSKANQTNQRQQHQPSIEPGVREEKEKEVTGAQWRAMYGIQYYSEICLFFHLKAKNLITAGHNSSETNESGWRIV